jgi:hypothetical protein
MRCLPALACCVQVVFELPAGVRAKDVVCDIKAKALKVAVQGKALLGPAPLPKRVKADESYWTLDDSSSAAAVAGGKVRRGAAGGGWRRCLVVSCVGAGLGWAASGWG